jgi:TPR repeat protein
LRGDQGRPRRFAEVTPEDLGAHRSAFGTGGHSPYVRRDADEAIADTLRDDGRRVVVVSGPRLAGTTRSLAHAARAVLGDHLVVAFLDDPDVTLAAMVAAAGALTGPADGAAPGTVLWLDRLSARRYTELARTDAAALPPGLRILAVADAALVRSLRVPTEAERAMLAHGTPIDLGRVTEAERRRLRAGTDFADPGLQARLDADDGTLLMGRLLVDLEPFRADLRPGTSANRTALLRAVADWRRVDPPRRLTWDDLELLYRSYRQELTGEPQSAGVAAIGCEAALKWAARPTAERPALVEERSDESGTYYSPHPLLAVVADEPGRDWAWPVADSMWEHADARFAGEERRDIGYAAIEAKASTAARRLLGHADTRVDPVALLGLGQELMDAGDLDAARHWFARVAEQGDGDADTVSLAYFVLGGLEDAREDAGAARRWWGLAIESGHAEWAPEAMVSLGELDWRQGNEDSARRWWVRASGIGKGGIGPGAPGRGPGSSASAGAREGTAAAGASDAAASAMYNLASVEHRTGNLDAARAWYTHASASGVADIAAKAMVDLGSLDRERGDVAGAREWWTRAARSGDPTAVPRAEARLAALEKEEGAGPASGEPVPGEPVRPAGPGSSEGGTGSAGVEGTGRRVEEAGSPEPVVGGGSGALREAPGRAEAMGPWGPAAGGAFAGSGHGSSDASHGSGPRNTARVLPEHAAVPVTLADPAGSTAPVASAAPGTSAGSAIPAATPASAVSAAPATPGEPSVSGTLSAPSAPGGIARSEGSFGSGLRSTSLRPARTDDPADAMSPAVGACGTTSEPRGSQSSGNAVDPADPTASPVPAAAPGRPSTAGAAFPGDPVSNIPTDPRVLLALGEREAARGRVDRARDRLTRAADTGDPDVAPRAMHRLGVLEQDLGEVHEARGWYIRAVRTQHADLAPKALLSLGILDHRRGWFENARTWFGHVVRTGHPEAAPYALYLLARLEQDQGETDEARKWFARAADSGHGVWAPRAMVDLGRLEHRRGDPDAARSWWGRAARCGHAESAARARAALDGLEAPPDHP